MRTHGFSRGTGRCLAVSPSSDSRSDKSVYSLFLYKSTVLLAVTALLKYDLLVVTTLSIYFKHLQHEAVVAPLLELEEGGC